MMEEFDSPGLYVFGSQETPLYVGQTGTSLWKRLRGRYVSGTNSQCQLAKTYATLICEQGIAGFPAHVRDWYRQHFDTSTVRLEHAVAFARHGIDTIWFALLPAEDARYVKELERRLIPVAVRWNRRSGYPPLLNKVY